MRASIVFFFVKIMLPRVPNIEKSVLLQYDISKLNTQSMIYGFSTNIRRLKGVNQQDWNSAQVMPNITLATSYEHRKMDGFVYQCKK